MYPTLSFEHSTSLDLSRFRREGATVLPSFLPVAALGFRACNRHQPTETARYLSLSLRTELPSSRRSYLSQSSTSLFFESGLDPYSTSSVNPLLLLLLLLRLAPTSARSTSFVIIQTCCWRTPRPVRGEEGGVYTTGAKLWHVRATGENGVANVVFQGMETNVGGRVGVSPRSRLSRSFSLLLSSRSETQRVG